MFDIGFWELVLIGVVALVVVGPERLPRLAYSAGKWLGKGRSMINSVKQEIDKEIKAEELKRILEEQKKSLNPIEEIVEETTGTLNELNRETRHAVENAEKQYAGTAAEDTTAEQPKDPSKPA